MLFKSKRPAKSAGTTRRPSRRTTLRFEPRPRRLTNELPPLPLFTAEPMLGTIPGISRRTSSATLFCFSSIASAVVTLTGAERCRFGLEISVPVTTISSLAASSSADCCANAGEATSAKPSTTGATPAFRLANLVLVFTFQFPFWSAERQAPSTSFPSPNPGFCGLQTHSTP